MTDTNATGGPTEPSNTDATLLAPLIEAGYEMIPLRPGQKSPKDDGWTTRLYKNEDQVAHMEQGGNVGVRLRPTDLVIDVDPRHFRNAYKDSTPFAEFILWYGFDPTSWTRVRTGGGGEHYYLSKPEGVSVVGKLKDFPGVEFKSFRQQVVAPGSVHPDTGKLYEWAGNQDSLFLGAEPTPQALIEAIENRRSKSNNPEGGIHTPEEIEQMLSALDVEEFQDQDEWFALMQACHHASGGDAMAEFIEWSTGDPTYSDDGPIISKRWESLSSEGDGPLVTYATLYKTLTEAGRENAIPRPPAENDFDAVKEDEIPDGTLAAAPPKSDEIAPLPSDAPMTVAKEMLKGKPLLRSNGEWFKFDRERNHYAAVPDERFSSWCWNWTEGRPYIDHRKGNHEVKQLVAGKNAIANIEGAARALRQGPERSPSWIKKEPDDPPASELLVCSNGLLHLPTRRLLPPERRFFSVNGSPVAFDEAAPKPERWLRFLKEVFPNEPDCIETLQEATGYFLTQDTSLQKIVQLVGPTRAGKGVYTRVLQNLVGEGNFTSPTAKRLSGEFGMQPLIGKQLAILSDMRLGRGVNTSGLTETLLTVSGEDSVSIPRKYKENWEGKLSTRFLIVSNELLQLRDTSNALGARMIVIATRQSFLGREDEGLTERLRAEMPGILNWALDGLDRLKSRGYLIQPKSCMADVMQMHKLASPVKWFLDTQVVMGPGHNVPKERIWQAFDEWSVEAGLTYTGGKEHFIKDLNSAGGRFEQSKHREGKTRVVYLNGLELKEDFLKRIYLDAKRDFAEVED